MHSIRHLDFPLLLLLLLLLSFTVAATADAFVPRRQRRSYLTESLSRLSIDLNQSKQRSVAILPFGLQIRGGDVEDVENGEEMDDAADSDETETVKKVWEEEIKRTQSYYQEQSVNNDKCEAIDDGSHNVEDVRGYGNSETSAAQINVVDVMEEGDDNEPAQADEDNVDIVEVKAETEENTEEVEEVNEEECVTENETRDVVPKEEEEIAEEEALQVEVDAEEVYKDSGEIENADSKEIVVSEEDADNDAVEESDEYTKEESAESEEVVAEDIIAEEVVEEVSEGDIVEEQQSAADEENIGGGEAIDISDTSSDHAADGLVEEEDADTAANDESIESTPEQTDASSVAVTDEPTSLVTKVSALVQVMLLRGRIAVSKNKGVQYLVQNKPKMKVIALAAAGGLSLFVGGHFFLAMQQDETETLELPNDEWIEEESYVEEEADEDDNDY